MVLWTGAAAAETLRIATWHLELKGKGPGLVLRDMERGKLPSLPKITEAIGRQAPDILLLTGIDWDYDLHLLRALNARLGESGSEYPYLFARAPNAGLATDLDLDGDGYLGGPGDAQGYGRFAGYGGMAVLSRFPPSDHGMRDFSTFLWADAPDAILPEVNGAPFPSPQAQAAQRLSSVAHWDLPVEVAPGKTLHILAFAAGPPVFDGPEDRNGLRNRDEVLFWAHYLNGALPVEPPSAPVVVIGNANLDPTDGEGHHAAITTLLTHPRLTDPRPAAEGGERAATRQGGANALHRGAASLDTVDWRDDPGPGNLRVSYVLPDIRLEITAAGIDWTHDPEAEQDAIPRHKLVWVDLQM